MLAASAAVSVSEQQPKHDNAEERYMCVCDKNSLNVTVGVENFMRNYM